MCSDKVIAVLDSLSNFLQNLVEIKTDSKTPPPKKKSNCTQKSLLPQNTKHKKYWRDWKVPVSLKPWKKIVCGYYCSAAQRWWLVVSLSSTNHWNLVAKSTVSSHLVVVHIEECYSQLCVGLKGGSRESKTRLVDLRELNSVCYYMILPFHFGFKCQEALWISPDTYMLLEGCI